MFDYKKEYREFYLPPLKPQIVAVPSMNYIAVDGKGDPNDPSGEYQRALEALYAISYTIKMSPRSSHSMKGYFEYVVPPLEGFWKQEGLDGMDYSRKSSFLWTSVIRLPDFVTRDEFCWARDEAERKKKASFQAAYFMQYEEGLCVQAMHFGSFDDEPATIALMDSYAASQGYESDMQARRHHEIYLSDFRRCRPEALKTVIRHPIRRSL